MRLPNFQASPLVLSAAIDLRQTTLRRGASEAGFRGKVTAGGYHVRPVEAGTRSKWWPMS